MSAGKGLTHFLVGEITLFEEGLRRGTILSSDSKSYSHGNLFGFMCSMAFHESRDHVLVSKLQHLLLGTRAFMYLLEPMKTILLVLVL